MEDIWEMAGKYLSGGKKKKFNTALRLHHIPHSKTFKILGNVLNAEYLLLLLHA